MQKLWYQKVALDHNAEEVKQFSQTTFPDQISPMSPDLAVTIFFFLIHTPLKVQYY